MAATPQERLALGVAALLLAAGAAARALAPGAPPAELAGPAGAETSVSRLAEDVAKSVEKEERRSTPLAPGEKIDPNTASVDDLDRLPRVGPALAQRIVDWRQSRGRFRSLADFDSVPGVGPAVIREAAPHLALASTRPPFQAAASVADWDRSPETAARAGSAASSAVLDLNTATPAQLETLPGIGRARAREIVARRSTRPFRSIDDLNDIDGIGAATVERLRPRVRVTP